jgi:hypothetical protein
LVFILRNSYTLIAAKAAPTKESRRATAFRQHALRHYGGSSLPAAKPFRLHCLRFFICGKTALTSLPAFTSLPIGREQGSLLQKNRG